MKHNFLFIAVMLLPALSIFGQGTSTTADKEAAYTKTIHARAEKIVTALSIPDTTQANKLISIIAGQYRNLNNIHTSRDEQVQAAKKSGAAADAIATQIKNIEDEANARLSELHQEYLAQLSKELTSAQIEKVKDGMTYGVVPITYKGYLEMIPQLTTEQKNQIMQWLVEAREHAMDAASSERKHWWFGKYKGRINNYLSAAGYDLKKEGEAWEKRRREAKSKSGN